MKKVLFILPLAILMMASCKKEDQAAYVNADKEILEFSAEGGNESIKLSSNALWNIETDGQQWYSVSPVSGNGNAEITITVEGGYTEAVSRLAQITIKAGDASAIVSLLQNRPEVPDTPGERAFRVRAYEQDYSLPAPKGYTYKVASLEGEGASVVSTDASNIVLHFDRNTSAEDREFKLNLTTTDDIAIETVTLTQSWRSIEPGELVIDEIFFTGVLIPDSDNSDSRYGDQYFKLTNTTDETLYADGVLIAISETDSQVTSAGARWAYPDEPDSLGVNTLYSIPGEGKDVAIEAGKSIVLAINAQNFKSENGAGCDLSKADFEFYDYTGNDDYPDIDNPDVKNLETWFKSSWTFTTLHDRGYESYAIAVAPYGMKANTFTKDYAWIGKRVFDFNGYHMEQDIENAYLIPNSWVLDAVNCAVEENLSTLAFNASVDAGYTNVSSIDRDPERYGKSVIRKRDAEGKILDTNNSTNDFEVNLNPTMK